MQKIWCKRQAKEKSLCLLFWCDNIERSERLSIEMIDLANLCFAFKMTVTLVIRFKVNGIIPIMNHFSKYKNTQNATEVNILLFFFFVFFHQFIVRSITCLKPRKCFAFLCSKHDKGASWISYLIWISHELFKPINHSSPYHYSYGFFHLI